MQKVYGGSRGSFLAPKMYVPTVRGEFTPQKRGHDLGDQAIRDWYRKYWRAYCRHRRLEHLRGRKRWAEFDDEPFGKIDALIASGDCLVDRVLDRVYAGHENP